MFIVYFYGLGSPRSYGNSAMNKTDKVAALVEFNSIYVYGDVWIPNKIND